MIVRFLAVLELYKQGMVELEQADRFGEIEHRVVRRPRPRRRRRWPSTTTKAERMSDDQHLFGDGDIRRSHDARRVPAGHRGGRAGGPRTGAARAAGPAARAVRHGHRAVVPRAGRRLRGGGPRLRAGAGRRRLPLPDPSPTWPRTSSASCSTTSGPGCPAAALETLAIVAYKQPISRAQIASIRGVDPDGVLRTLQGRGFVDAVGRDAGPGPGGAVRHHGGLPREARPGLLDELPPIAEFIPGADVVEALEDGLPGHRWRTALTARGVSGCRRCWPAGAGGAAGSARS